MSKSLLAGIGIVVGLVAVGATKYYQSRKPVVVVEPPKEPVVKPKFPLEGDTISGVIKWVNEFGAIMSVIGYDEREVSFVIHRDDMADRVQVGQVVVGVVTYIDLEKSRVLVSLR